MIKKLLGNVFGGVISWWLKSGKFQRTLWRILFSLIASYVAIMMHDALDYLHGQLTEKLLLIAFNSLMVFLFSIFLTKAASSKNKANKKAANYHKHGFHTRVVDIYTGMFSV